MALSSSCPKQGPQQRSREGLIATAQRKAWQPKGSARGQGVQKQPAGRCHTRQQRAARDKLFVQQFTAETHAVLDITSSAEPQPVHSHGEVLVKKRSRGKDATASREDSGPAESDAEAPARAKARGSKACVVLQASLEAGAAPMHSEAAALAGKIACGSKDRETCRDGAAGTPHASRLRSAQAQIRQQCS
jgi:hypothetical protein